MYLKKFILILTFFVVTNFTVLNISFSETLKISVMLLNTNGKELSKPIFNKVTKTYNTSSDIEIKVLPKKLIARRAKKPKVTAKLRKYNDEQN